MCPLVGGGGKRRAAAMPFFAALKLIATIVLLIDVGILGTTNTLRNHMWSLYDRWRDSCLLHGRLTLHDKAASPGPGPAGIRRTHNWSVEDDLDRHQNYSLCTNVENSCRGEKSWNVSAVLESIRKGSSCCAIEWQSKEQVCHILQMFSRVYWIGDSLTRHMVYGMYQLLLEDLEWAKLRGYGGATGIFDAPTAAVVSAEWIKSIGFNVVLDSDPNLPMNTNATEKDIYRDCLCDGMYTDNSGSICRKYDLSTMVNLNESSLGSICPASSSPTRSSSSPTPQQLRPFLFFYRHHSNKQDLPHAFKCINDPRPQFIYLSSINAQFSAEKVRMDIIGRVLGYVKNAQKKCEHKMRYVIVWSGASPTSDEHDAKWPLQTRAHGLALNRQVDEWLLQCCPDVKILDFFQMTMNDSSHDGLHFQTSTNVKKASALLRVMELMAEEFTKEMQRPLSSGAFLIDSLRLDHNKSKPMVVRGRSRARPKSGRIRT
jgi:hypothetical protein